MINEGKGRDMRYKEYKVEKRRDKAILDVVEKILDLGSKRLSGGMLFILRGYVRYYGLLLEIFSKFRFSNFFKGKSDF